MNSAVNFVLHSMQRWEEKEPWASTSFDWGTPAARSRVSMFWVKHLWRRPLVAVRAMKAWVIVGVKLSGWRDFARV
jgi:hypothetical protein